MTKKKVYSTTVKLKPATAAALSAVAQLQQQLRLANAKACLQASARNFKWHEDCHSAHEAIEAVKRAQAGIEATLAALEVANRADSLDELAAGAGLLELAEQFGALADVAGAARETARKLVVDLRLDIAKRLGCEVPAGPPLAASFNTNGSEWAVDGEARIVAAWAKPGKPAKDDEECKAWLLKQLQGMAPVILRHLTGGDHKERKEQLSKQLRDMAPIILQHMTGAGKKGKPAKKGGCK